jgi:ABC-type sugar transport system permease subunit
MASRSASIVERLAATRSRGLSYRGQERLLGIVLVAPMVLVMLGLLGYPFLYSILISFTNTFVGMRPGTLKFIGLANYAFVLQWPDFWVMVKNTFVMTGGAIIFKLIYGMIGALVLNETLRGRGLYRALVILPWATPGLVAALLWRWMMDDQYGVLNYVLVDNLHLFKEHIAWLASVSLAMPSVIFVIGWQGVPFWIISFLAGMQAISPELYEAAKVDGANAFQRWRYITIPGIRHVLIIVVMLSTIWTSQNFATPFALTNGGPGDSTMVFTLLTFILAVQSYQLGEGAAIPVMVFPIFATLIVILTRYLQGREGEAM